MLIKYSGANKFIFVANPKCASSSIEASEIGTIADIKILRSPLGKHISIREIYDRFDWIFEHKEFSLDKFFKWGIIRDPISRVISWYNYRSRQTLKNPNKYTGNLSFQYFWTINKTAKILEPQYHKFFDSHNESIKVDYLCRQETLFEDLIPIRNILGIKDLKLSQSNLSFKRITAIDIEESLKQEIREYYCIDYDLIADINNLNRESLTLFNRETHHSNSSNQKINMIKKIFLKFSKNF